MVDMTHGPINFLLTNCQIIETTHFYFQGIAIGFQFYCKFIVLWIFFITEKHFDSKSHTIKVVVVVVKQRTAQKFYQIKKSKNKINFSKIFKSLIKIYAVNFQENCKFFKPLITLIENNQQQMRKEIECFFVFGPESICYANFGKVGQRERHREDSIASKQIQQNTIAYNTHTQ